MKKVAFLTIAIIVLAVSVASAAPDLDSWLAQAQSTPGNVTADATGWVFDGTAGVPYNYGALGETVASVEYIFNLSDSGVSVALGSMYGYGAERNTYKLEQWPDLLVYGITLEGYYDETYPGIASTFDVLTHVIFVTLDGHQELFLNGVSQGIDSRSGGWWTSGGEGFLGSTSWGADVPIGAIHGVASYNRALDLSEVSDLYSAFAMPVRGRAGSPNPANRSSDACNNGILSWEPGIYAVKHDVYFGTDETTVADADRDNPLGVLVSQDQDAAHYPIAGTLALDFATTYYWRIDEVNAAPGYDIYEGSVWQFTTAPISYQIDNIIATASSSETGKGPENTVNLSGDLHSNDTSEMWLSGSEPSGAWILYEFDSIYKLHEMRVWNYNGEFPLTWYGLKNVTIEYSTDGVDYTTLGATHEFAQAPGTPDYAHDTTVNFGGAGAKYVKISANSNHSTDGAFDQYGLSEVRFFHVPVHAAEPYPENAATTVPLDVVLGWKAGRDAATHNLYLSTDRQAVVEGAVAPVSIPADGSCSSGYAPAALEFGKTYYWKINEVNLAEEPDTWEGDIWSFSTPEYIVVDDMASYGDADEVGEPGSRIWFSWQDGEGWLTPPPAQVGNGTGSVSDIDAVTVYDTPGSLKYYYNNDGTNFLGSGNKKLYSEVTALVEDLQVSKNWTASGLKSLALQFYGDPGNDAGLTEQMYLKLNGAKVLYDGEMNDITEPWWHQWNIDLAQFGIDLGNVTEITIGFGDESNIIAAGSGVVHFDDIRLYPARCMPWLVKPSADLDDDCTVNYTEVDMISANWLVGVYEVTPAAPDNANLVGRWTFDNVLDLGADSTGNNNGTLGGNVSQSADAKIGSGALSLDGDNDFISVGGGPFFSALDDNGNGFTVAAWVKLVHTSEFSLMRIFSTDAAAWLSGQGWGFGFIQPPARLRFTTYGIRDYDAGGWMSSYLPDNNQWIHVAAVYKSDGDVDFYVDGMWIETVAGDFSMTDTDAGIGFLIGGFSAPTSGEWFAGLIDDLRIYDTELSHGQVGSLANRSAPYIQDISPLLAPHNPDIDWSGDGTINFGDFAGLMQQWLDELLWPQ